MKLEKYTPVGINPDYVDYIEDRLEDVTKAASLFLTAWECGPTEAEEEMADKLGEILLDIKPKIDAFREWEHE